jgi:UDP-GlcNAc:undecaprenyl-phosphate GlcNAc-1-phosphate transferase
MGQVYNIGGTEEISILDLAQRIIAACNSSSPIRLVPIFDTILVTYSRNHSGRKVSRGGLDHTSHRLVSVGFSEKQAVLILYGVGGFAGLIAVLIGHVTNTWVLTMILPAGVAVFLFGRFLFKQNVYAAK